VLHRNLRRLHLGMPHARQALGITSFACLINNTLFFFFTFEPLCSTPLLDKLSVSPAASRMFRVCFCLLDQHSFFFCAPSSPSAVPPA
jgi:hypothetical protein